VHQHEHVQNTHSNVKDEVQVKSSRCFEELIVVVVDVPRMNESNESTTVRPSK
jgi:hypothetical protein